MEYPLSVFLIILAGAIGAQFWHLPGLVIGEVAIYAALWLFHRPKGGYR